MDDITIMKKNPRFIMIYVILLTCLFYSTQISFAAGKITALQPLSGDQTISSEGGSFVLGFFRPGNSSNYYIGIWYNKISQQTVVWVANRDKPVLDKYSAQLIISNGILVLFDESNSKLWSTNLAPINSTSVEAALLDNGNLVLRDGSDSNLSDPFWQSFDNPTDTFLPGARLGLNKFTGIGTILTSWKNENDPAPGLFSFQLDPNGTSQFYILRDQFVIYWTSGTWNGQIFSLIPEMMLNHIYNFSYVTNEKENYLTYAMVNNSITSRFVLDVGGQIQQLSWLKPAKEWMMFWSQPRVACEVYAYCGGFGSCNLELQPFCRCLEGFRPKALDEWFSRDYSAGCAREAKLQCGNSTGKNDRFLPSHNMLFPANPIKISGAQNAAECESTCLNNCSCSAYAYSGECTIWSGDLLNVKQLADGDPDGGTLYLKLSASEFSRPKNYRGIVIGVVVGSIVLLILLGLLLQTILRRTRTTKLEKEPGTMSEINKSIAAGVKNNTQLVLFTFKSILAATSNFSEANELGEGGFGPVYKGNMPGGQEMAIKRLSKKSGQGLEEFLNELKLIANLQHKYLVRLLGYCIEKEEKILIYEYMPNRSLDKFLFDPSEKGKLPWDKRINIVQGVAQGLLYIHEFSRMKIIHRDLKASNILLDEAMNPKISDFGMARIFGINQTQANTNRIMGTYGYMSPEYAFSGQFSEKSDVFSFGVFLLEVVSGMRNTSFHRSGLSFTLLSWAWELWKEEKEAELIDISVKETCCTKEAVKCIQVGLLCVQDDPIDRPTMSLVVSMLSGDAQKLPSPKEPAFHTRKTVDSAAPTMPKECSNNELTVSFPTGR